MLEEHLSRHYHRQEANGFERLPCETGLLFVTRLIVMDFPGRGGAPGGNVSVERR